ncbi:MAG: hypothetical protein AAFN77_21045 [Planctomycetota bacterium]
MNAKKFVEALASLAPRKEELIAAGFSASLAESYISSLNIQNRESELGIETYEDELLALCNGWQVGSLEIGFFTLGKRPTDLDGKFVVGKLEQDEICFNRDSRCFFLLETYSNNEPRSCPVANNGSDLLDVLQEYAAFIAKLATDEIEDDDDSQCLRLKEKFCCTLGGDEFLPFLGALLGC